MGRTAGQRPAKDTARTTRGLDEDQLATWRALAELMVRLQWALESQLQRDAGLSFIEYHTLARLSEEPTHTLRMSELAVLTNASLSRLSHLVSRLESRGLVRREPDPTNGRFTNAILTKAGYQKLVASAPAHVEAVRSLVIDEFNAAELRQLRDSAERLLTRVRGD
jgi:DNA-binding MarR family transcriptional regulator